VAVSDKVKKKLHELPDKPGVYLMRDRNGKVIYIGKAKSLRNRVRNYFQRGTLRSADAKIRGLIKSIDDFDFLIVGNDAEAILTEGRMIKEYRPRYNTSFKDDKRFLLLRLNRNDPWPVLKLCRIRRNDTSTYFGPYASAASARAAKNFAEKRFGLRQCTPREPNEQTYKHCLADIIRQCCAPCVGQITRGDYLQRVDEATAFLKGERGDILKELQAEMEAEAEALNFERAAVLRDTLLLLRRAVKQRARGLKSLVTKADEALEGLKQLQEALRLPTLPRVIETFDISNISGTSATASMVVAIDGLPAKNRYRMFRINSVSGPDDPGMMAEATRRRYRRLVDENKPLPDLIVFDGGITQLRAGRAELDKLDLHHLPSVGLAKRYEEVYWDITNKSDPLRLPLDSPGLRVLTNIRDEAHRFALTYHRKIREKRIRDSALDEIPGIGEKRKLALLQHFGSVDRLRKARVDELAKTPGIGHTFAELIHTCLHGDAKV
jgi:excinuclease ABC subunit C